MHLRLSLQRAAVAPASEAVLQVAAMFGLGLEDQPPVTIVSDLALDLGPGQVVFLTGPSGGGKTSLLRLIAAEARRAGTAVLDLHDLPPLPSRPLVEVLGLPLSAALPLLSLAGLADAFVLLRTPEQLSDGQRYRLRLAQAFALVRAAGRDAAGDVPVPAGDTPPCPTRRGTACHAAGDVTAPAGDTPAYLLLADEFAATLDRVTAAALARNVRRWVDGSAPGVCFVAATTHDDLLEPLHPDLLIYKDLGGRADVLTRESGFQQTVGRASLPASASRKRGHGGPLHRSSKDPASEAKP